MSVQSELLDKYVGILRLRAWGITLNVLTDEEYQEAFGSDFMFDTNACTELDVTKKAATINIRASLSEAQTEETLLHECVHLITSPYDSFVQGSVMMITTKRAQKAILNDALWEMELLVTKVTNIVLKLIKENKINANPV